MNKIFGHKGSFWTRFTFTASYGADFPLIIGVIFEIVSSLQIMYLILATNFPSTEDHQTIAFHQVRDAASFIGLFRSLTEFETELFTLLVWFVFSLYLIVYIVATLLIVTLCIRETGANNRIVKVYTYMNITHTKVLFCPIYFYYLNIINSQKDCKFAQVGSILCETPTVVLTFFFIGVNLFFAALKELYLYQACKSKNVFSAKTNIHAIIQLTHKAVVLPLLILVEDIVLANSIMNAVFTAVCHLFLVIKLPFYNVKYLKTAVSLSVQNTTIAFVVIWKSFTKPRPRTFELLIIILVPIMVKFMLGRLRYIFEKILMLKSSSPEYVVHLPTLVKEYIFHPKGIDLSKNYKYEALYTYGLINFTDLDIQALQDPKQLKSFKHKVYILILGELLKCHQKHPKSIVIMVFLIQFYVEKIKNISSAIKFMQKVEGFAISLTTKSALLQIQNKFQSMLFKAYSDHDPSLELISYFKYKEISTILKKDIETEVKMHIEFWQILSKDSVEVHKVIQACKNLDILASKIRRTWKEHNNDFVKNFPVPLIMYGIYLSVIRGLPHHGQTILSRSKGRNSKLVKFLEKWFTQEKALVVVSNQQGQIGKILDASHSVKTLFNIDKEELIGRKINTLMPSMIEARHDRIIQRYNEKPIYALNVEMGVYCKTVDKRFFPAMLEIRVYPYIDKGIGLIGMITKKEDYLSILILNEEGAVIDCSQELLDAFSVEFSLEKRINIQKISPELEKVNRAFNAIHKPQSTYITDLHFKSEDMEDQDLETPLESIVQTKHRMGETLRTYQYSEAYPMNREDTVLNSARKLLPSARSSASKRERREKQTQILDTLLHVESVTPDKRKNCQDDEKKTKSQELAETNEYEEICNQFKNGKAVMFHNRASSESLNVYVVEYYVKIEPLLFERRLYKIVKLKRMDQMNQGRNRSKPPTWTRTMQGKSQVDSSNKDKAKEGTTEEYAESPLLPFSSKLPPKKTNKPYEQKSKFQPESLNKERAKEEATGEYGESPLMPLSPKLSPAKVRNSGENDIDSSSGQNSEIHQREELKHRFEPSKTRSDTSYQGSLRMEKTLYSIFSKEKTSSFIKAYFVIFYFAMLLVTIFAGLNYQLTNDSFGQVELGAKLVDRDSERLTLLMKIWESAGVMYSFIIRNKTIPDSFEMGSDIENYLNGVKQTNRDLTETLAVIPSQDVLDDFYKRDINLWDSFSDKMITTQFDVFMAIHTVSSKFLFFNIANRGVLKDDPTIAIFALNNTVNDLLLSAEKELQTTHNFKKRVYDGNVSLLAALLIVQIFSIAVVFFSLIVATIALYRAFRRLFKALYTIPNKTIEIRNSHLFLFLNCLQESVESLKFIQELNAFYEVNVKKKEVINVKLIGFKEENKLNFAQLKLKGLSLLAISCIFFMVILVLFYLSSSLSLQNINSLQNIDDGSKIIEKMGYQLFLLNGNLINWMAFNNQYNIPVRNEPPEVQFEKNLKVISGINRDLVAAFSAQNAHFNDPIIEKLLSTDVCSSISAEGREASLCTDATKGNVLGMLGVIVQYGDLVSIYAEKFKENPSYDSFDELIDQYLITIQPTIVTLDRACLFFRSYLFRLLLQTIQKQSTNSAILLGITCAVCSVVTLLITVFILTKFKEFDKAKYEILKLVPQNIMLENKAILFYLSREFKNDLAEIKSIL